MIRRSVSPVIRGAEFGLPFSSVIIPAKIESHQGEADSEETSAAQTQDQPVTVFPLSDDPTAPPAFVNRFITLGVCSTHRGILHTLYFTRRPIANRFTIEDDCKVSGYLTYSYLKCGSSVVGLVFITDKSRTLNTNTSLRVVGGEGSEYVPNFNLEKLGLLMFTGRDSSVLVIPNEVDSPLLVRTD